MKPRSSAGGSILTLAGCSLALPTPPASTSGPAPAATLVQECEPAIRGVAIRDQDFETPFADGLAFRLAAMGHSPPNPQEWTIEVRPRAFPEHEYTYYVSPPFRFWNPRFIGTSYGYTAARAVEHDVRDFRFLTSEEDFARARRAIDVVLWPGNYSGAEYDAAVEVLGELAKGRGTLRILDSELSPPTADRPLGAIERLEFEVTLCLPAPPEAAPDAGPPGVGAARAPRR